MITIIKALFNTIALLFRSLIGSDILILVLAIVTLVCYYITKESIKHLNNVCNDVKKDNEKILRESIKSTSKHYNTFITLISIFPLLGMLGTVFGLLGLDLAAGDMENIKNNFFIALTSTAWGIIFSIIYKILNARIVEDVEYQIEIAKEMLAENKKDMHKA